MIIFSYRRTRLTAGAWNPTRYSIFYTARMDGSLDLWDVLHQQKEPNMSIKVKSMSQQRHY